jgi:hypothetical protein
VTYLAYAGIGARKTPTHIQNIMRDIGAYLCEQGWVLRSGAAPGADTAFEDGVDAQLAVTISQGKRHWKEIYLPWVGFNNHPSTLHPRNIPFTDQEMRLSAELHPAWDRCSPSAKLLHQRNVRQFIGCKELCGDKVVPSKFAVCWTENGQTIGGTGQALRIAHACGIPIINLGTATNATELEMLVLEIDRIQNQFKKETISHGAVSEDRG